MNQIIALEAATWILIATLAGFIALRVWVKYFSDVPPVFVDGLLYVIVAVCGAYLTAMGSSDAYKYCDAYFIWYSTLFVGLILQGANALRTFRSKSYSEHVDQKARDKAAQDLQAQTTQQP